MQMPSNSLSWYYRWNAVISSSDQDMSLTVSKFAQLPTVLFGTITVLLLMSSSDKILSRFLILEHEWVTKCQIKVDVPTLILVY